MDADIPGHDCHISNISIQRLNCLHFDTLHFQVLTQPYTHYSSI